MKVKLYKNFKKRKNSTLRPSGDFLEIDCTLKNGTSIVNPTIQLQLAFDSDYSNYNYCQIPDFGRFYYIRDLVWNNSIAEFVLVSDKMASFKTDIGNFSGLAVRASNSHDDTIPDPLLPPSEDIEISTTSAAREATYRYVIIGAGEDGITAVIRSDIKPLAKQLSGVWAQVTNQVSGINACYRTLLGQNDFTVEGDPLMEYSVGFGAAKFNIAGQRLSLVPSSKTFLTGLTLQAHPQAEIYGNFLNGEKYRQIYLYNSGIGFVHLPASAVDVGDLTINGTYSPDNGATAFRVICDSTAHCITQITTNLYASIPFCGSSVNIAGVASGVAGTAGGIGAAMAATTPAGAIAAGIGAGVSAISGAVSALPTSSISGVLSGISSLDNVYSLVHVFRKVKDNDNINRGRPLLRTLKASSGGYIEYERVNLSTTARADEKNEIESIMERGFYYE